jgi:purine-binding chemotaxis protein CheW
VPQRRYHDPAKNLVGFIVGDVEYAISIAAVREIANPMDVVALPRAPLGVSGVADFRGEVVPVVDLRARFGLPAVERTRRTKWILADVGECTVALVADAVTDVFGGTETKAAPPLGGGEEERGIVGVTKHDGALVFVLDVCRLRELTERVALAGAGGRAPSLPGPGGAQS